MSHLAERAIRECFLRFLNDRPLDKISVKDIVEDCGISRKTFYNHFPSLDALLETIFLEETERAMRKETSSSYWTDIFLDLADFILNNRSAFRNNYYSRKGRFFKEYLFSLCQRSISMYAKLQIGELHCSEEDLRKLTSFYAGGISSLVEDWVRDGMQGDLEGTLCDTGRLLRGSLRYAMEEAGGKH